MRQKRFARDDHVEIFRNRGRKSGATGGEPLGMEMALDEVRVRKVDRGRDYDAIDHGTWSLEEILIVRALGGAVGHNQRRLTAAAGTSAALGVIGRCRGHVAQVNDVHR